jgi:hypothetical protein
LQQEIKQAITHSAVGFYWLRIVTIFLHRPLRHLGGHNPRLFRKDRGRWTNDAVHEQVETVAGQRLRLGDTSSRVLPTPLLHHSHETIVSYRARMHEYTSSDADAMSRIHRHRSGRPVKPSWFLPWYLSSRQFIKLYGYRRGFLDGYAGLLWCFYSSYYEWEMAQKYKEKVKSNVKK